MARIPEPFPPAPPSVSFNRMPASGSMTIDALMARQKEAAAAREAALATPQTTLAGGIGQMLNSYFAGKREYDAAQLEKTSRAELAKAIGGYDPDATDAQQRIAAIYSYDPDLGLQLMQDAIKARRDAANQERFTTLSEAEEKAAGLPIEGVYERSSLTGQTKLVDTPTPAKFSRLLTPEEIAKQPNLDPKKPYRIDETGQITEVGNTAQTAPLTEFQSKALGQYGVAYNANDQLSADELDKELAAGSLLAADQTGFLKPYFKTPEQQVAGRAALDFASMVLRKETGAAIGADEMEQVYDRYIPRPGDSPELIADKRRARAEFLQLNRGSLASRPEFQQMEQELLGLSEERRKRREARQQQTAPAEDDGYTVEEVK